VAGSHAEVVVAAPASQVRLAVERLGAGPLPAADRALVFVAGRLTWSVEAISHTRTRLAVAGGPLRRVVLRLLAARTARRAVHYTRFGIRTGASTTALPGARRRP